MSWERFDSHQKSILSYILTVLTILGVLFGVWTSIWEIRIRQATKHLGTICQDADKMGYFVADVPAWWRRIFLYVPRVPYPEVPTISSMIKAGDLSYFDCGMFDCEYESDASVSWRSVFEAYFLARVWAEQLGQDDVQSGASFASDMLRGHRHTHRSSADAAARYAVWLTKERFESQRMNGSLTGPVLTTSVLRHPKIGDIEHIEPHFLYYAWDIKPSTLTMVVDISTSIKLQNSLGTSLVGPILVRSAKPLPVLNLILPGMKHGETKNYPSYSKVSHAQDSVLTPEVDGSSEGITEYGQPVVHDGLTTSTCDDGDHQNAPVAVIQGSPMLEQSANELAALSNILGIEL
nr:hypothetical protein B0A51_02674 [Rachicladosporium sp. CCFEE 5018]